MWNCAGLLNDFETSILYPLLTLLPTTAWNTIAKHPFILARFHKDSQIFQNTSRKQSYLALRSMPQRSEDSLYFLFVPMVQKRNLL